MCPPPLTNGQQTRLSSLDELFILPFISCFSRRLHLLSGSSLLCPAGETFSENYSHTEGCSPCTLCTGLMRMETPCTDSNDAVCVCDYNYFLDSVSGRCELCTVCPVGQGVYSHCEYDRDTVCEECLDNTYSDRESSLDPCLPCTICDEETETELAKCTPSSDSVCHSKSSRGDNPLSALLRWLGIKVVSTATPTRALKKDCWVWQTWFFFF